MRQDWQEGGMLLARKVLALIQGEPVARNAAGQPDRALDLMAGSHGSGRRIRPRAGGVSTSRKQLPPPATRTYSSAAWFASLICRARYRPRPVPYSWVV